MRSKKILIFILALLVCVFCVAAENKMVNVNIQGVDCPFCSDLLLSKLSKIDGVDLVRMNKDRKRLLIVMKPGREPDLAVIQTKIKEAGYLPTQVTKSKGIQLAKGELVFDSHIAIKNQPCENCHVKH